MTLSFGSLVVDSPEGAVSSDEAGEVEEDVDEFSELSDAGVELLVVDGVDCDDVESPAPPPDCVSEFPPPVQPESKSASAAAAIVAAKFLFLIFFPFL